MQTSVFLAQLIGPLLLVIGVGMAANAGSYRAMAEEFLASRALIYVPGCWPSCRASPSCSSTMCGPSTGD